MNEQGGMIPQVTRFVTGKDDAEPMVVEWLRASYAQRPDGSVSKAAVYHQYTAFCEKRALEMANRSVFGKLVKRTFPFVGSRRLGKRSENSMHYTHIAPIFSPAASASPSFAAVPSATPPPAAGPAWAPTSRSSMPSPSISAASFATPGDGPRGRGLAPERSPAASSMSMAPLSCPRSLSHPLPEAHDRDPAGWVKMAHLAPQRRWSEADSAPQRPVGLDAHPPPLHTTSWHVRYTPASASTSSAAYGPSAVLPEYDLGVSCGGTAECSSPGLDRSRPQATDGRQATSTVTPQERTPNRTFGGEHLF